MREPGAEIGVAIIHLAHLLPDGSSDLPGGRNRISKPISKLRPAIKNCFGRAALVDASLFGLAPRGVCLAAHVTMRAGALLH
jgi:hypothetical protein